MKRIRILIWKEFRQLKNDPVMLRLMILPVFAQMFILGYAVTTEVRNTPVVICDMSNTPQSRSLTQSIAENNLFAFRGMEKTTEDVRSRLDAGDARAGILIARDFAKSLEKNEPAQVQLILDGQDANSSNVAGGYLKAVIQTWAIKVYARKLEALGKNIDDLVPVKVHPVILFNPLLKSTWYMVPAIAVLLVTMVTALLTGFSIVKERESGTMEQLMVTPLKSFELVIGKSVPFMLIGFLELCLILAVAKLWFAIPFNGSYSALFALAFVYMFSSIGLGVLISSLARTPHQALYFTWFVLIFFVLLSGFFLPLENMPHWIQQATRINPLRYFMLAVREIFLKGSSIKDLWKEAAAMIAIGVGVYSCAIFSFKRNAG